MTGPGEFVANLDTRLWTLTAPLTADGSHVYETAVSAELDDGTIVRGAVRLRWAPESDGPDVWVLDGVERWEQG
jgi:hypothetical protein